MHVCPTQEPDGSADSQARSCSLSAAELRLVARWLSPQLASCLCLGPEGNGKQLQLHSRWVRADEEGAGGVGAQRKRGS